MIESKTRWRLARNGLFKTLIGGLSLLSLLPLCLILFQVFQRGLRFVNWDLLLNLPKPTGEPGGGVANAIVGTLMLVLNASLLAVPLGVGAGVYLTEHRRTRLATFTRLAVDILQGMPSVVLGIVAYIWLVRPMGRFSALSGSLALALMMLPLVVRGTEEVLKMVPAYLKEASLALGVPNFRTILRVILPVGIPGIVSGILLGVSRIAGETAPLLFTSFGNRFHEFNPLKPVSALPMVIFNYAMSPYEDLQNIAWGASVVLILIVLAMNIISRLVAKKWKVQF